MWKARALAFRESNDELRAERDEARHQEQRRFCEVMALKETHGHMTARIDDLERAERRAVARAEAAETALLKLNVVRDQVIRTQRAGWSSVIYPLVKILNEAGIESTVTDEELAAGSSASAAPERIAGAARRISITCRVCGVVFRAYRTAMYCTNSCKNKAIYRRARMKAGSSASAAPGEVG
jgi:hypothetical protein